MYKKSETLSRGWLSNPHSALPLLKRLEQNGSVNIIQNSKVTDLGNGYDKIEPINPDKRFKGKISLFEENNERGSTIEI